MSEHRLSVGRMRFGYTLEPHPARPGDAVSITLWRDDTKRSQWLMGAEAWMTPGSNRQRAEQMIRIEMLDRYGTLGPAGA